MSRISVVVPIYNSADYVAEAIQSILDQSVACAEIIVVDDGSEDNGVEIARSVCAEAIFLSQPNQGPGQARNLGVRRCTGDFLSFLDADDVWEADKIEVQLEVFHERPESDFVFGLARQFYSPSASTERRNFKYHEQVMMAGLPSAMLARRDSFLDVGLYSSGRIGTEIEWYMRAKESGKNLVELDRVVYHRRLHGENAGIVFREHEREKLGVLRDAVRRRREARSKDQ